MMLSNGLLIYVEINIFTGDIKYINFDKYFVGKTISENICDGELKFVIQMIFRFDCLIAQSF